MTDLHAGMRIEVTTTFTTTTFTAAGKAGVKETWETWQEALRYGQPDNSYASGGRQCLARGNRYPGGYQYVCLAAEGHAGDHIGWHSGGRDHADDAVWPQD